MTTRLRSRRRRCARGLGAALVALFVGATATPVAEAQRDPRSVAADVHARGGYGDGVRFRSPTGETQSFPSRNGANMRPSSAMGGRYDGVGQREISDRSVPAPQSQRSIMGGGLGALGGLISQILLVVVIAALLGLVGILLYSLWQSRGQRDAPSEAPGVSMGERVHEDGPLPWVVGDPDALARERRFAEAILALLVQSLQASGWRGPEQRSRTAREILFALAGTDPRRPPLSEVVRLAERVRFAGEPATEALFHEVRAGRDRVVAASGPGAGAA